GRGWHTAEALPIAIPKLKAKGFEFVTVSELIALGEPVITSECYDRKPGDTNRYDLLANLTHRRKAEPQKTVKVSAHARASSIRKTTAARGKTVAPAAGIRN